MIHPRPPAKSVNKVADVAKPTVTFTTSLHDLSNVKSSDAHNGGGEHHIAVETSQVQPVPAHAHVDRHHAELRPAQTLNDVYLTSNIDSAQSVVTGGSKL